MAKAECTCKTNFNWKQIVIAIVAIVIVSQIVHMVSATATMGFYMDPAYTQVWSNIMMPTAGPPPATFYYYSILFTVITAMFFTMVYSMIGCCVPGKTLINRGLTYGLLIFLVGGLPSMLTTYLIINIPAGLAAYWAVEILAINLIGGMIVAKLIK